jgi:hypothetical protein
MMNSRMETNLDLLNPFRAIPFHRRDFLRMAASISSPNLNKALAIFAATAGQA